MALKRSIHVCGVPMFVAIAGLLCVALAMVGAFALVADIVFSDTFATFAAGIAAVACAWCW